MSQMPGSNDIPTPEDVRAAFVPAVEGHRQVGQVRNGNWKFPHVEARSPDIFGWFSRRFTTDNFKSKVLRSST